MRLETDNFRESHNRRIRLGGREMSIITMSKTCNDNQRLVIPYLASKGQNNQDNIINLPPLIKALSLLSSIINLV